MKKPIYLIVFIMIVLGVFELSKQRCGVGRADTPKQEAEQVLNIGKIERTPLVGLQAIFQDKEVVPDVSGKSAVHQGTATYLFKNNLPKSIKIIFPPICYTAGGSLPLTPSCNQIDNMPKFCQQKQTINLKPNETRQFQAGYTILMPNSNNGKVTWHIEFIFGSSDKSNEENIFIGSVYSDVIELRSPNKSDDNKK